MSDTVFPPVSSLLSVLKLFVIPAGGGIPAGVMLAQAKGLAWPVTTLLYLVSDVILAIVFEPILRLITCLCGNMAFFVRISAILKAATARSVSHFSGTGAGPLALVMIAFGVDPMTGRASALAAGHGFIAGWAIAIAGDMLYFAVIAAATLGMNSYIQDTNVTMVLVIVVMFSMPVLVRFIRQKLLVHKKG